jgi:hypothetical protein
VVWAGEEIRMVWQWERNEDNSPKTRTVGAPAACDLLAVTKEKRKVHVQTIDHPWNLRFGEFEPRKTYLLTLVARSDETDSDPLRVRFCWDGEWEDDEGAFASHLLLEPVPERSRLALVPRPVP